MWPFGRRKKKEEAAIAETIEETVGEAAKEATEESVNVTVEEAAEELTEEAVNVTVEEAAEGAAEEVVNESSGETIDEASEAVSDGAVEEPDEESSGEEADALEETTDAAAGEMSSADPEKKKKKKKKSDEKKSIYEWTQSKKGGHKNKAKRARKEKRLVVLNDVVLGAGIPKICVPVTGKDREEIIAQTQEALRSGADLVEWRADYFEQIRDPEAALQIVATMTYILQNVPLLFTFRTAEEGGVMPLNAGEYAEIIRWAAAEPRIPIIDIEGNHAEFDAEVLTTEVHTAGKKVIASAHFFKETPKKGDMMIILDKLERTGADIIKLAVMPSDVKDVLKLMDVTAEKDAATDRLLITMSMGELGRVTRVSGRITGSVLTFGTAGAASAPGQIPVEELRSMMQSL
ncbi:MAG: type I 3-dehydroquinate dehydratase [Eubacterium sp.]|nr:type I 3-dehydroquinate dehydratase [Eubacterium sp.]